MRKRRTKRIVKMNTNGIVVAKSERALTNGDEQIEVLRTAIRAMREYLNSEAGITGMKSTKRDEMLADILRMQMRVNDHFQAKILHRLSKNIANK